MIDIDKENILDELTPLNKVLLLILVVSGLLVSASVYFENRTVNSMKQQETEMKGKLVRLGLLENLYNTLAADNKTVDDHFSSLYDVTGREPAVGATPIDRVRAMAKRRHMVVDWVDERARKADGLDIPKGTGLSMIGTYPDFHLFLLELSTRPFIERVSEIQIFSGSERMDIMMDVAFKKPDSGIEKDGGR